MGARWSDRQLAMLEELGIRLWQPASAPVAVEAVAGADVAVAPAAAERVAPPQLPRAAAPPAVLHAREPAAAPAAPAALAPSADLSLRAQSIAAMGWPELRAAVADCQACRLCESRRHTVFGVGHERAHWMLVGEAPGEQEDTKGEPFVGKAGQLLDNMLASVALTRAPGEAAQQVFIANVLKCRPPGNRNPEPQEVAQCEPFLKRQVELVQPRIILAMGRFAVQSLLASDEPIGRLRGRVHRWHGVPLVVTYHPAYLLRNPTDKAKAWEDLCLAQEVMRESIAASTAPGAAA